MGISDAVHIHIYEHRYMQIPVHIHTYSTPVYASININTCIAFV